MTDQPKRIYLSGPISGLELTVYKTAFAAAKQKLDDWGYEGVSPLDVYPMAEQCIQSEECAPDREAPSHHWSCWLKADLVDLLSCDGIAMMDGWAGSHGCKAELVTALAAGIPVYRLYSKGRYEQNSLVGVVYPDEWKLVQIS